MVLLSMTSAMVDAIHTIRSHKIDKSDLDLDNQGPSLSDPAIGRQIAHTQVIELSKLLRKSHSSLEKPGIPYHLDDLLRGSKIYDEPPHPKAEPVSLRPSLDTALSLIL